MSGRSIRRFGARAAITGLVLAGALVGTSGLAAADEDGHQDDSVTVDVDKDISADLGENVAVDVAGDAEVELGENLEVDVNKDVKLDLGKKPILNTNIDLRVKLW